MSQKPVLGKGLASLLPNANSANSTSLHSQRNNTLSKAGNPTGLAGATSSASPLLPSKANRSPTESEGSPNRDRHPGISLAAIHEIHANQLQPRRDFEDASLQELAQSIRSNGIIQPLIVRKTPSKEGFELIAGERRLRATKLAGLKQVPIVIRRSTDRESLELALIENIQRENLNCIDEALAYFQLIQDFTLTQEEIAERVGKDRASVANFLRLLRLPEAIIEDLKNGRLTFGHGKVLLSLEGTEQRMKVRGMVLEKGLSIRETEAIVQNLKKSPEGHTTGEPLVKDPVTAIAKRLFNLAQDLTRKWSTKVEVKGNDRRGKIVIHYGSNQELDRLLESIGE